MLDNALASVYGHARRRITRPDLAGIPTAVPVAGP
jgi:hypothetical protein